MMAIEAANYFAYFGLTPSFVLDEKKLKKQYYLKSRAFHPDFFTQADEAAQEEALQASTYINTAYQTLNDFDRRMKYVLELRGVVEENEKYKLPPMFLMEMMDLNEEVMELQFDRNETKIAALKTTVEEKEKGFLATLEPTLLAFPTQNETEQGESLLLVKDFFYKKRYLLRLLESLDKFVD